MKELVLRALAEQFPKGATAAELLDFFEHGWGRHDIVRTSLSPQLSRLRQEGKIELDRLTWSLPKQGDRKVSEHDFQEFEAGSYLMVPLNENEPPHGKPEGGSETALHAQ